MPMRLGYLKICMPNKTLQLKGEKYHGGKTSKERLTVLVTSTMDGCFKSVKYLPVEYRWNKKSWMTSQILVEWVRSLDKQSSRQKRKVLLC